ncbi:hypothetical protein BZA05DRAFT_414761 [Tricharina praecox]|uniref:uncharacterized protein n=1 Tax=Tricharina praecox TaxID=43433 RepID=UPI00221EAE15|nr:uncharacterized protein BZA05DRAFT_414761 [Tricharina praecox]KAI5859019.1 hypothetical protein BZA05DRAFT_414761 [Tricharina praecox]
MASADSFPKLIFVDWGESVITRCSPMILIRSNADRRATHIGLAASHSAHFTMSNAISFWTLEELNGPFAGHSTVLQAANPLGSTKKAVNGFFTSTQFSCLDPSEGPTCTSIECSADYSKTGSRVTVGLPTSAEKGPSTKIQNWSLSAIQGVAAPSSEDSTDGVLRSSLGNIEQRGFDNGTSLKMDRYWDLLGLGNAEASAFQAEGYRSFIPFDIPRAGRAVGGLAVDAVTSKMIAILRLEAASNDWTDVAIAPKDSALRDRFTGEEVNHMGASNISVTSESDLKVDDATVDEASTSEAPTVDASTSTASQAITMETPSDGAYPIRGEQIPAPQRVDNLNPVAASFTPKRKMPQIWQTQCRWTVPPDDNGRGVDNCRYGRRCNFGHLGEEYYEYPGLKQSFTNGMNTTLSARIYGHNSTAMFNPRPYHVNSRPLQASSANIARGPTGYYGVPQYYPSPPITTYQQYPTAGPSYRDVQPGIQQYPVPNFIPFTTQPGGNQYPSQYPTPNMVCHNAQSTGLQYPVPNGLRPDTPSEGVNGGQDAQNTSPVAPSEGVSGGQDAQNTSPVASKTTVPEAVEDWSGPLIVHSPTPRRPLGPAVRSPARVKALADMRRKKNGSDDSQSTSSGVTKSPPESSGETTDESESSSEDAKSQSSSEDAKSTIYCEDAKNESSSEDGKAAKDSELTT